MLGFVSQANQLSDRKILFNSAMKMIIGFQSFKELYNKAHLSSSNPLSLSSNSSPPSQIILSSLAASLELSNNLELSYQL